MCLALPARVVELSERRPGRRRPRRRTQAGVDRAGARGAGRRLRHRARRPRHRPARPRGGRAPRWRCSPSCRQARMKYVDEFRDGELARGIAASASPPRLQPGARYSFMEFCGGHTHAIARYGVTELLPAGRAHDPRPRLPGVRAADRPHRPGHPPGAGTRRHRRTYGDTMRVPGRRPGPLAEPAKAKARGADIRMVYSPPTR
jgi:hypothetical protein